MAKEVKKIRKKEDAEVSDPTVPTEALPTATEDKAPVTAEAHVTNLELAEGPAEGPTSKAPAAPPKAPAEGAEVPPPPNENGAPAAAKAPRDVPFKVGTPLLTRCLLRIPIPKRSLLRP